jgi:hypothetical protein
MRKKISKYLNIYVVVGWIGFFSFAYMLSFAFVQNDISSGSSRDIRKKYCEKNPQECNVSVKRNSVQK